MSITESFSIWPLAWETIRVSNLTEFLEKSLIRLPIIVPVVWAALTVSKRRSEMHRLAEEYAHKEALAKSYEGFKQQIIDMDINTKAMLAELLGVLLKAVSLNIPDISVTSATFQAPIKLVFADPSNIPDIFVTLLVSVKSPKAQVPPKS